MTFESVVAGARAHAHYSQIFIQVRTPGQSVGVVVDLIEELGGDLMGLDIVAAGETQRVLRIRLSNELVGGIVLGLMQGGYLQTIGFGRAFCGGSDA